MASDYLLEIDGIKGESSVKPNAIEIESFSWGVSNAGSMASGGGHGAGKASFQDMHFTCKSTSASPALRTSCATGKHWPKVTLWARLGPTGDPTVSHGYLKIELKEVMVSGYSVAAGDVNGDSVPDIVVVTDRVALNFKANTFFDVWPDLGNDAGT